MEEKIVLSERDKQEASQWVSYLSFKKTWPFKWLSESRSSIVCLYTGNQFGKNASVARHYVDRLIGKCLVKEKNFCNSQVRTIRFISETLPESTNVKELGEREVSNTQYPEFRKWCPPYLIRKDITSRTKVMSIKDRFGGSDFLIEFMSYGQDDQRGAGQQRASIWIDEEINKSSYEEQIPRLYVASQKPDQYIADVIFSFTPAPGCIGWEFDELFERARWVYRTRSVRNRWLERTGQKVVQIEDRGPGRDITVIMASTYDNPTFSKEIIDGKLSQYDDQDVVDARGYGMFRQLSGKIFKTFEPNIHIIDLYSYKDFIPRDWKIFRGIDFHEHNDWAIPWVTVSPEDEMFIYQEYSPNPEKVVNYEVAREITLRTGDYKSSLDLIDPLANKTQTNTGRTVIQDLNDYFQEFKREGLGTGGYWEPWDTKNPRGRDEFRKRLKNSIKATKPFLKTGLPTIWFHNACTQAILSMKNWRIEEWASRESLLTKDAKNTPQMRWSHYPIAIECLLKRPEISMARFGTRHTDERRPKEYFNRRPWA